MKDYRKTIQIDLDGVLNNYDGNYNNGTIAEAKTGVDEFLRELSKDYKIEILTVQNKINTVLWLQKNNLLEYISDITSVKNQYASLFIDDRAINFSGNYKAALQQIKNFKPYWKE